MTAPLPPAPVAARRPHETTVHGHTIDDPYAWLKDPAYPTVEDPDILAYLQAENACFEAAMAPHAALVETLFEEMKGRIEPDESSVPQADGDWIYWTKYAPGGQYPVHWRKRLAGGADAVVLDEPAEAEGKDYFRAGALAVSPDGHLAAWSADTSGAERFAIRVRDLATGADVEEVSAVGAGAIVWAAGSDAIAYAEVNQQWRPYRIRLHRLGTDPAADAILYEEPDEAFRLSLGRTQDRRWMIIASGDHQTSEVRIVPLDDLAAAPVLVSPRREKRLYSIDSGDGRFWVLTNDEHINFRVAEAAWDAPGDWRTVIAGSDATYLMGLTSFARHLVLSERVDGLDQIGLRDHARGGTVHVPFPEASYTVGLSSNPEYDPATYRLGYTSLVTPRTVFALDPASLALETLKTQAVPSGYDPARFATARLMAPARDGARVPVSVVFPKGYPTDGTGKLFLYAYGAYGHATQPYFSAARLSLLERGWAFAIAHIRGGDEMGYGWYLDGKAEKRWNTFRDFSDAARALIAGGYAAAGRIAINGGSAGGELMGVVANTDPDLWGAVVADVPFVDVLNTMQDASLPLTPAEWPEWGDPITDPKAFALILSYSPYENVTAQCYPPMLITGGLNDPRVTYWEPAKWAARLRATKTDANALLLKINMGAGHGGKSGRFEALRERAEAYAFVLTQMG